MKKMICTQYGPVKNNAGIHGTDIGAHGAGLHVTVDETAEHDGWVPVVGPEGLGPVWLKTGEQGWIKLSRLSSETSEQKHQYLVTTDADGSNPIVRQIS